MTSCGQCLGAYVILLVNLVSYLSAVPVEDGVDPDPCAAFDDHLPAAEAVLHGGATALKKDRGNGRGGVGTIVTDTHSLFGKHCLFEKKICFADFFSNLNREGNVE